MENNAIPNLLEDAYLVLAYAVRAGRLRDDTLPKAIMEVEKSLGDKNLTSLVPLSSALNSAVTAIAPITLVDLRVGRSPFDKILYGYSRKLQYWLCGLTVILAFFIALYSFSVQRKESALREYLAVQTAHISEKIDAWYRLAQHEEVRTKKDPRWEQYQRALNEIQVLDARDQAASRLLAAYSGGIELPFQSEIRARIEWILRALFGTQEETEKNLKQSAYENVCDDLWNREALSPLKADITGSSYWQRVQVLERNNHSCFKKMMGIKHSLSKEEALLEYISQIRDSVVLLNVWILPFLSGLLGATVFLLRDSLNPLTAIFGLPRVVVRLALGGIAGIIIGWFWIPSGELGAEFSRGSSMPLALAFVTGFSIDILFSVLDRIRRNFSVAQESTTATAKGLTDNN